MIRRADQRREAEARLLEAAVAQLAEEGMRGLTHRRIERRAGLAQGSAKYYFGTLDALVRAVLDHLARTDLPLVLDVPPEERAASFDGDDPDAVLQRAQAVVDAVMARPEHALARLHVYLYAAGHPQLQPLVSATRDAFVARIARSFPGPGAEAAARFVCVVVDGLLLDQLSAPNALVDAYAPHYLLAAGAAAAGLAERDHANDG